MCLVAVCCIFSSQLLPETAGTVSNKLMRFVFTLLWGHRNGSDLDAKGQLAAGSQSLQVIGVLSAPQPLAGDRRSSSDSCGRKNESWMKPMAGWKWPARGFESKEPTSAWGGQAKHIAWRTRHITCQLIGFSSNMLQKACKLRSSRWNMLQIECKTVESSSRIPVAKWDGPPPFRLVAVGAATGR